MTYTWLNIAGGGLMALVLIATLYIRRRYRSLDKLYFEKKWKALQKSCTNKKLWCQIVVDADGLLDEALKKRHYRGKTTGERLVSAQHKLTQNDAVWFSHKLRNKIVENKLNKISKKDTLEALNGFLQALRDLGALNETTKSTKAKAK